MAILMVMTARWRIKRKLERTIAKSGGDGKPAAFAAAKISRWQNKWKLLPPPANYSERHQYDSTGDQFRDFMTEVLEVWDLCPNLRDAICSVFVVRTVSERVEWRATLAIILSVIATAISVIALLWGCAA